LESLTLIQFINLNISKDKGVATTQQTDSACMVITFRSYVALEKSSIDFLLVVLGGENVDFGAHS